MKQMILRELAIICIALPVFSCNNGRNELMTRFVNEKKVAEDSLNFYDNSQSYYEGKAKESMHAGDDSVIWKKFIDSNARAFMDGTRLKRSIEALNFSIDSLTKMQ